MPRLSYFLFGLAVIGLSLSIVLHNNSKTESIQLLERTNTVKEILFLLERTEKLKNILRKTVFDNANAVDTALVFSAADKSEVDSILNRLRTIALYIDQRQRIDTIKYLINHNFSLLLETQPDPRNYKTVTDVIAREQEFAQRRLQEQVDAFAENERLVGRWNLSILLTSGALFIIGVWSLMSEDVARRQLRIFHESILQGASIGICVVGMKKTKRGSEWHWEAPDIKYSNFGALSRYRSGESEVLVDLTPLLQQADLIESAKLVIVTGKSVVKETSIEQNHRRYWFITNLSRVSDTDVAFYYQDITPLKQYESELRSKISEMEIVNKDLEQFAHATSHDLREPFRKIHVMADLIKKSPGNPNISRYLDSILRASMKGSLLVEQILNYSKTQFDQSELSVVDLNRVVDQVREDLEMVIVEKEAMLEYSGLPILTANEVQMTQLFTNLISNALKFSSPQRNPLIRIDCREVSGAGFPGLHAALDYYLITIEDNGIGFDEKNAQRIFVAFERLHHYEDFPGFGLGLSLCKKIVVNHGGMITATSVPGSGSKFFIYLAK
jgi:signal transduction histidine kinase